MVLAMADLDEALVVYEDALAEAHRRGSTLAFAAVKVFRAQTLVWRGDLGEAEAEAREALAARQAWGSTARFSGHASAFLADALMEQGRLDDAAAALASVGFASLASTARACSFSATAAPGCASFAATWPAARSSSSTPVDASTRSAAATPRSSRGARPPRSPCSSSARATRPAELATEELELARAWGAPRALGAALRARGSSRAASAASRCSRKRCRCWRARLRSSSTRRRAPSWEPRCAGPTAAREAREHLRQAVELATICGAASLAARAERELLATGARPRRVALSGVESLTPSERRVAEMAAEGPTNREIAQALFVTQRTVEVHLTSIYRKLAISSRSQLAAALAGAAPD